MLSDEVKTKLQSLFLQERSCPGRPHIEVCPDCIRSIVSFAVNEAVAAEREACDRLAYSLGSHIIANAIRARGEGGDTEEHLTLIKCCRLGCGKEARWVIYDEDIPIENDTYSCTDCLGEMLSVRNYVAWLGEPAEPTVAEAVAAERERCKVIAQDFVLHHSLDVITNKALSGKCDEVGPVCIAKIAQEVSLMIAAAIGAREEEEQ